MALKQEMMLDINSHVDVLPVDLALAPHALIVSWRGPVEKVLSSRRCVSGVVAGGDGAPVIGRECDEGVHEHGHGRRRRRDAHQGEQAFLPPAELANLLI